MKTGSTEPSLAAAARAGLSSILRSLLNHTMVLSEPPMFVAQQSTMRPAGPGEARARTADSSPRAKDSREHYVEQDVCPFFPTNHRRTSCGAARRSKSSANKGWILTAGRGSKSRPYTTTRFRDEDGARGASRIAICGGERRITSELDSNLCAAWAWGLGFRTEPMGREGRRK